MFRPARAIAAIALLTVSACGGDSSNSTSPTAVTFAGTYQLQTVNGQKLPYVAVQSGNNAVTITADQLSIADGGSWSETITVATTTNGTTTAQTAANSGAWVRSGSQLALLQNGANYFTGTFSSNRLDLANINGATFVYTK